MADLMTEVEFAGRKVVVPVGGYYDRFRSNPDLDEVARDPEAGNIDFFRRMPKQKVETRIGPTWAPNFYYRSSSIQLLFLAPIDRLRAMLPEPLEPLRALPGYGLVALTIFAYRVCDNDPYNEVSVAVVVRRPDARGSHAVELMQSMKRRSFFAHVLALPVDTDIARVRGVEGYQLPKWLTPIDVAFGSRITASVAAPDGTPDISLSLPAPKFRTLPSQSRMGTNTMLNRIDGQWRQISVQSNTLRFAQQVLPSGITLKREGGPLTQLLDGLGASTLVQLDVTQDAQLVLHMPSPITAAGQFR